MERSRIRSLLVVLAASALLIGFGIAASQHLNLATAVACYLFITLAIARQVDLLPASLVSLIAVLCLAFFFAPPIFSFRVDRTEDWIALATFEAIALIVSHLSYQARLHERSREHQRSEQRALYELCRDTLLLDWRQSPGQQLCTLIKNGFPLRGVAMWNAYEDSLCSSGEVGDAKNAVKGVFFVERNYDDISNGNSFRVLRFGTRAIGALVLCGHTMDELTVNSIASVTSLAIERARSLAVEIEVEAERHSEQLRSAVLDGLAHAFKTPLSTITVASSALLAIESLSDLQLKLVTLVDREAGRLSDLTTRLLRTSRLEPSQLVLQERAIETRELLQGVLNECAFQLGSRHVEICLAHGTEKIRCDPQVLTLALVQILDNAAKYGSHGSPLVISGEGHTSQLVLRVHNEGSYIPPSEQNRVFARFYRSPSVDHRAPGTGLGLSVAKRAVEAHGGRISIESDMQTGTTFVISIPVEAERIA